MRRSSPRLATLADGNSETAVCSSSAKPSVGCRRSLRRISTDGNVDSTRNLTSVAGSNTGQAQHCRQVRNSVIESRRRSRCMEDIAEAADEKSAVLSMSSSKRSAVSDNKLIDSCEPAALQPARRRRKCGWPKGVPHKKKQVIHLCGR